MSLVDHIEAELERLHAEMQRRVNDRMGVELRVLQGRLCPRHSISFVDVMGIVAITVGEHDITLVDNQSRLGEVLEPFDDLLNWYLETADRYRVTADELKLEPIR